MIITIATLGSTAEVTITDTPPPGVIRQRVMDRIDARLEELAEAGEFGDDVEADGRVEAAYRNGFRDGQADGDPAVAAALEQANDCIERLQADLETARHDRDQADAAHDRAVAEVEGWRRSTLADVRAERDEARAERDEARQTLIRWDAAQAVKDAAATITDPVIPQEAEPVHARVITAKDACLAGTCDHLPPGSTAAAVSS